MRLSQRITIGSAIACAAFACAGSALALYFFFYPFALSIGGYAIPAPAPATSGAFSLAFMILCLSVAAAQSLFWLQQRVTGFFVWLEMRRVNRCFSEIARFFGQDAADEWLSAKLVGAEADVHFSDKVFRAYGS